MRQIHLRVSPEIAASDTSLRHLIAQSLGIGLDSISSIQIRKQTIDARQRKIFINLSIDVYQDGEMPVIDEFTDITYPDVSDSPSVVVVGAGPCGLFASLKLIERGLRPILIERGANVSARRKDLSILHKTGIINPESNYSFGEGGAGAFSDGKLYTRSKKRGNVERILRIFCRFGADPKILVDAHPHIGTDKLPMIIKRMRQQIISSGGKVHFHTKMTELLKEGNKVLGIRTAEGKEFKGVVILATGHSARDVYKHLYRSGIEIEAKAIAVGVRLEHPQELIDSIRYHSPQGKGRGHYLPPAEYVYKTQSNGRGVYSFCMCPGGFIVPASTDREQTVVNGMSPANRGSRWANSGLVVELRPEDLAQTKFYQDDDPQSPLKMMYWCEVLERESYVAADRSLRAPAQRMTDFLSKRCSADLPSSSYNMGLTSSLLTDWMPSFVTERLADGFRTFDRQTKGFITQEAQLIGVESRTSAPVRIPRLHEGATPCRHISIEGLFPAGEGAGYAGGIVSAAIDGENVASAVADQIAK